MVNQTYLKNDCEEEIVKKEGKKGENSLYFSKFFGKNAKKHMFDLLKLKASGQKVLFIVDNEKYFEYANFKNEDFEVATILSSSMDYTALSSFIKSFDENIKCVLAIGGDEEIGIAKYIASVRNLELVVYVNRFVSIDSFIPFSFLLKNGIVQCVNSKKYDYIFIDSDELLSDTKREDLAESVFAIISKLGLIIERYINCCLQKDNGYNTHIKSVLEVYGKLNKILDNAIDLSSEDILALMDLNLEFADLLININYCGWDKETQFASLYKYMKRNSVQRFNALKAVGVQVFVKLYCDFMKKLDVVENTYFDIEKRVKLFDSTFNCADLEFDLGEIVLDKELYLLKRFKDRIIEKLTLINTFIDKLMYKTLDLFYDSGYSFLKDIDKDTVLKCVYFTADIKGEKILIKTMRNLGVLDFYDL